MTKRIDDLILYALTESALYMNNILKESNISHSQLELKLLDITNELLSFPSANQDIEIPIKAHFYSLLLLELKTLLSNLRTNSTRKSYLIRCSLLAVSSMIGKVAVMTHKRSELFVILLWIRKIDEQLGKNMVDRIEMLNTLEITSNFVLLDPLLKRSSAALSSSLSHCIGEVDIVELGRIREMFCRALEQPRFDRRRPDSNRQTVFPQLIAPNLKVG